MDNILDILKSSCQLELINSNLIFLSDAAVLTLSVILYHVYGDTDIVIEVVFIALSIINSRDSISIGDHDILIEAFRFLIYKVFKEEQYPKASLQDPCLAPNFVVFAASNTPALSIAGE